VLDARAVALWTPEAGQHSVRVADAPAGDTEALLDAPVVTIAVGDDAPACDLFAPDEDAAHEWESLLRRAPRAACVAALLVRRESSSLVAESLAYSLLQSGPEFAAWLERRGPAPGVPDPDDTRVHVSADGGTVTLARPRRANALDVRMRDALCDALDALSQHDGPITVQAEGRSFCTGGDLDEFGTAPPPVDAHLVRLARSPALRFQRLAPRMTVHLRGQALGSGIELAAFASRVVAAPDARIGLPELDIGLVPGAGGTVSIVRRIGRRRFFELLVRGQTIDAPTALDWGLVDDIAPARHSLGV
jgi:enoyl-CoA hydratase/carnithine racemase